MSRRRRQDNLDDEPWRMVEGEHESFDTSILEPLSPPPSSSGGFPSQPFSQSQGTMSFASQDSIGDFARHQEDEQVILREPFRPSLSNVARTPEMEFRMPKVDVDGSGILGESDGTVMGLGIDELRRRRVRGGGWESSKRKKSRRQYDDDEDSHYETRPGTLLSRVGDSLRDVLSYIFTVIGLTFRYAQRPLAIFLAIYLSLGALLMVQNMLTRSVIISLSPICRLPGTSLLHLPFCPSPDAIIANGTSAPPVEFDDLMRVQERFEQVLEMSIDGVSLPFEMKRSESSVRDLRSLVRHSDLRYRDEMLFEFDRYVETARTIALDLQRFNVHVGSAVDSVITINHWTSIYIDSLAPDPDDVPSSLLEQWWSWIFRPFQPSEAMFNEQVLREQYMEHTSLVSNIITKLILEGQAVLRLLGKAEGHLSIIHKITTQSSANVASTHDQILWTLWALVGGNTLPLHNLEQQIALLKQVDVQRTAAVAQIKDLILELEDIQAGLGDLRERLSQPELLRDRTNIPLSVHIETINRGVERLELARRSIRAAENDRLREALVRGGLNGDEHLIGVNQ